MSGDSFKAPTAGDLLRRAAAELHVAGVDTPALDAAVLLGHAVGRAPERVLLERKSTVEWAAARRFEDLVRGRRRRVPVSRLVGRREFYSRPFIVTPDVLDPRPETEILVQCSIERLRRHDGPLKVLELGTGSGAVAVTLALEIPGLEVVATDVSPDALRTAWRNVDLHGVSGRVRLVCADMDRGLGGDGSFAAVVSNPPYVSSEEFADLPDEVRLNDPAIALLAGDSGTEFYPPLISAAGRLLAPGGDILLEVGGGREAVVAGMLEEAGFTGVSVVPDLAGRGRVVSGVLGRA